MPLGKRTDCGNARYAGVWPSQCANVVDGIQEAFQIGFDFVAVSLNHAKLGTGVGAPHTCIRSDLDLQAQSWTSQIVGVASEVEGDADGKRFASVLGAELGWASYLGLQAVILPSVGRQDPSLAPIVAQAVSRVLSTKTFLQIWVQVPVSAPVEEQRSHFNQWHTIRAYSNYHRQVRLALLLGEELPSAERLDLWAGEPVRSAIVPVSVFKFNAKGYPTLSKAHQDFLAKLYALGCQVIIRDDSLGHKLGRNAIRSAQDPEANPLKPYWEYLSFLFRRMEALSENEQAEFEYRDYLQSPLQPLQDHLESATYEVFERDRTKYETYEEAVYRCLLDKFPLGKVIDGMTIEGEGGGLRRPPTVMVVGAGRGPLVMASLRASKRAKVPVRVFAVEKNPNAYVTLLHLHQKEKWGNDVTIVHTDMRSWVTTEKADIMVSELLGSFGDNELSPECLDGAQRFLADDGVSIPQSYTSFLAPITCSRVYEEVKALKDTKLMETPYVVKLFAFGLLSENKKVFRFDHPNRSPPGAAIDNERCVSLTFARRKENRTSPAVLHGFAGYFESILYKDVLLSIRPETHTPNMFSWFPIFFPLMTPVYLSGEGDQEITVHMWRCHAKHRVWYEYCLGGPVTQPVVNPEGRSYAAEL